MASSNWMESKVLSHVSTGFCNIKTPDTGNPNAKNPQFRNKPPTWKLETIVDRERDAEFLEAVRQHVKREDGTAYDAGQEPWVLTREAKTVTNDSGEEVTYPAYEYIRVQTKKNPHDAGLIFGEDNTPFTDEVFSNSDVTVVVNTMYNPVSNHIVTFYLGGLKVHRNGSGGGGGGKAQAMQLLGIPSFESITSAATEDAPKGGGKFDPSQV